MQNYELQSYYIEGNKCDFNSFPSIIKSITFLDEIYIGHINKLGNIQECHSQVNLRYANINSLEGIGRHYFKLIDNTIIVNTTIEHNILGLLLVKKLLYINVDRNKLFSTSIPNSEPFEIIGNYLQFCDPDILECQEELISNNYQNYAKL